MPNSRQNKKREFSKKNKKKIQKIRLIFDKFFKDLVKNNYYKSIVTFPFHFYLHRFRKGVFRQTSGAEAILEARRSEGMAIRGGGVFRVDGQFLQEQF